MSRPGCQWHEEDGSACDKYAVQGKAYCARHQVIVAREEYQAQRKVEDEALGETADEVRDHFEAEAEERQREQAPATRPTHSPSRPRRERPVADPELLGGKMAAILIAQDAARRLATAKGQVPRNKWGERIDPDKEPDQSARAPRVPFQVQPRRPRRDITRMQDPKTGEGLLPPTWIGRWVREIDGEGRPSQARVEEFRDYGYEVVLDREGHPLRGPLGVAMMAPPEQYAERVKDYMPTGALNRDDLLADAYEAVEESNRYAGGEVVKIAVESEHSRRKAYYEPENDLRDY